jgi:hypothetical protein
MMIDTRRYTSGRIAVANLSTIIDSLELRRVERASFQNLVALSTFLFVRGNFRTPDIGHREDVRFGTAQWAEVLRDNQDDTRDNQDGKFLIGRFPKLLARI